MLEVTPSTPLPAIPQADPMNRAYLIAVSFLGRYLTQSTRDAYKIDLKLWFDYCHQQLSIDPLNARRIHAQAYVQHLMNQRGNKPATVNRRIGTVRSYYEYAIDEDFVEVQPCRKIVLPKIQEDPALPWLDRFELSNLMRAAAASCNRSDEALVCLMAYCGMRVSAACNVQIEDIETTRVGYKQVRTQGKGGKILLIVLPIPMYEALERAIGGRTSGPVFVRPRSGKQCNRRQAAEMLRRLARDIALTEKRVTPHALRRSFCTAAFDANLAPSVIQAGMGHSNFKTTQGYNKRGIAEHAQASHTVAAVVASVG